MIRDVITSFSSQFSFVPEVVNPHSRDSFDSFVVCGMGGSHLAADILCTIDPLLPIVVHKTYGIPTHTFSQPLYIVSSYSGNTEEALDSYVATRDAGHTVAVITGGGALLSHAQKDGVAYIQVPSGLQPRMATGYMMMALVKMMGDDQLYKKLSTVSSTLHPETLEEWGRSIAQKIKGTVPLVYSSSTNSGIGYAWKIALNETGKIPAFCNVFPELNHNEMTGFDGISAFPARSYSCLFLYDDSDHPRIARRMDTTARLLTEKGIVCEPVRIEAENRALKICTLLVLGFWISATVAELYGNEPEQVPMVESFKKLLQE